MPLAHPPALRQRRLWLALWWLAQALVLIACLLPMPAALAPPLPGLDKLEHALAFLLLGWFAAMLFAPGAGRWRAWAGLLGLALLIELLQAGLPWRSADPFDLLADALGLLAGIGLAATPALRLLVRIERAFGAAG